MSVLFSGFISQFVLIRVLSFILKREQTAERNRLTAETILTEHVQSNAGAAVVHVGDELL